MKNSIRVKLKKTISLLSACTLLVTSVAPLAETVFVTDAYAAEEAMEIPDEEVTEIPEAPDYEEAAVEVPDAGSEAGDPEYPDEEQPDEAESSDSSEAVDDENAESDASLTAASSGSKKGIIYWNSDTPAVFLEGATDTVRVTVSAGIGAFPEGVVMNLKPANDEKTLSRIKKTVEKDGETKVADVLAVDITFVDAEGYEIEPAAPICVTMTDLTRTEIAGEIDQHGNEIRIEAEKPAESAETASNEASEDAEQPDADENDIEIAAEDGTSASADGTALAVHIDDKGRGELLPTPTDIHIKWNEEEIEDNTKALQEVFADSSVIFEAEKFSVYAIVYTESNTETISGTDTDDSETEGDSELSWPGDTPSVFLEGDTDEVHVTVAAGVGVLPEGVTMTVSPVTDEDVLNRIRAAAEEDSEEAVAAVQAVDILFFDADGNEVKPAGTVCVTMKDLTEEAEASAENNVAVSLDADGNSSLPETPEEIHIEWKDEEIEENTATLQQVFADSTVIFETEEPGVCAIVTRTVTKTLEASDGNEYRITVTYDSTSGIPANAELKASEIKADDAAYESYVEKSAEAVGEAAENVTMARAFDISLVNPETGEEYQPDGSVKVTIELLNEDISGQENLDVVHFPGAYSEEPADGEVLENSLNEEAIEFETSGFSVYVVVQTIKEQILEASDGQNYKVTVEYDSTCGIPMDAELQVSELNENDPYFTEYVEKTAETLGKEAESFAFAHAFDIKLVDKESGEKYQLDKDVKVKIELLSEDVDENDDLAVVHFKGDVNGEAGFEGENGESNTEKPFDINGETGVTEVLECNVNGETVEFETGSFSVYVIVETETKPTEEAGWKKVSSLTELDQLIESDTALYVSNAYYANAGTSESEYYFWTNEVIKNVKDNNANNTRWGIRRTGKSNSPDSSNDAARYYFEKTQNGKYQIYCYDNNNNKKYLWNNDTYIRFAESESNRTPFSINLESNSKFSIKGSQYINLTSDSNGKGFAAYSKNNDGSKLHIWYYEPMDNDPYSLNHKSYCIAYHGENNVAGLTARSSTIGKLDSVELLEWQHESGSLEELLIDNDIDLADWTFISIAENRYYITTQIDGSTYYLTLATGSLKLEGTQSDGSVITIESGSGENDGKYRFRSGSNYLALNGGDVASGFVSSSSSEQYTWLNLANKTKSYEETDLNKFVESGNYTVGSDTALHELPGTTFVRDGDVFNMTIRYSEKPFTDDNPRQMLIENETPLIYTLPENCSVDNGSSYSQTVSWRSFNGAVTYNSASNSLELLWDFTGHSDSAIEDFKKADNISFDFTVPVTINVAALTSEQNFDFGNGKTLTADKPHNPKVTTVTSEAYDASNQTVTFTATLTAENDVDNNSAEYPVVINNAFGSALSVDSSFNGTFTYTHGSGYSSGDTESTISWDGGSHTGAGTNTSFSAFPVTIAHMYGGDTITLTYTAKVDTRKIEVNGSPTEEETGSTISITNTKSDDNTISNPYNLTEDDSFTYTAPIVYPDLTIKEISNEISSNGYPIFGFAVTAAGITNNELSSDNLVITDTLDTDGTKAALWKLCNSGSYTAKAYGLDTLDGTETEIGTLNASETRGTLTFTLSNLKKTDDSFYNFYKIVYYITPTDDAALLSMRTQAIASDPVGDLTFTNSAKIGDSTTFSGTLDYTYHYLPIEKTITRVDGNWVYYKIVVNPDALQLNGGSTMDLKDTFYIDPKYEKAAYDAMLAKYPDYTGQSIDYSSVERDNEAVSYDYSGYTGTFKIPDSTRVTITYRTRVLVSDNQTATFSNTAVLNNKYNATVTETRYIYPGGDDLNGTSGNYWIRLFKYVEDHMETGLDGAVFRLLDSNQQPLNYTRGTKKGQEITYTTDTLTVNNKSRAGYAIVQSEPEYGFTLNKNTVYYLEEITAPVNGTKYYKKDSTLYSFMITDNPTYNSGGVYRYFNGDTLKVRNYEEKGGVYITKRFSGNITPTNEQKNAITFSLEKYNQTSGAWEPVIVSGESDDVSDTVSYTLDSEGKPVTFKNGYESFKTSGDALEVGAKYRVVENGADPEEDSKIILNKHYSVTYIENESGQTVTKTLKDTNEFTVDATNKAHNIEVICTNEYIKNKLTIKKVDEQDGALLSGAVFTTYNTSNQTLTTYTTDENGLAEISYDDKRYSRDTLYYAAETKAPSKHILPEEPEKIYFYFSSSGSEDKVPDGLPSDAVAYDLSKSYAAVTVANRKSEVDIPVVKVWDIGGSNAWPDGVDHIVAGLYRTIIGSSETEVTDEAGDPMTLTLTEAVPFDKTTFSGLPAEDAVGNRITYSVKELHVYADKNETQDLMADYAPVYSVMDSGVYVIKNYEGVSIDVSKKWYNDSWQEITDPTNLAHRQPVTFDVYRCVTDNSPNEAWLGFADYVTRDSLETYLKHNNAETVLTGLNLSSTNNWVQTVSSLKKYNNSGEEYKYFVVETKNTAYEDRYVIVDETSTESRNLTIRDKGDAKPICKIDDELFYTLNGAIEYILENDLYTATIEMLTDYIMPVSDAVDIPRGYNITLTTAETGDDVDNPYKPPTSDPTRTTAVITRYSTFTDVPMITNQGSIMLENITLDGDNVSAGREMIYSEGSVTIGTGATLENANNSGNGGAIYAAGGSITVSGGNISNNTADSGGAIYMTAGSVTVTGGSIAGNKTHDGGAIYYSGTATVSVSGGSISENEATDGNGGAIYAATGTVELSGNASLSKNEAPQGYGGALYVQSAVVMAEDTATLGENEASRGGGIYAVSGTVTLSDNSVLSKNKAAVTLGGVEAGYGGGIYSSSGMVYINSGLLTENEAATQGGAIYADTGTIYVSGGSMTKNKASNGAAVFVNTGTANLSGGLIGDNDNTDGVDDANIATAEADIGGGAVGVGSETAKLNFSNTIRVIGNKMTGGTTSNVFLDQNSDSVINASHLVNGDGGAKIGVYVPNRTITVDGETVDLYNIRGIPGAKFATYSGLDYNAQYTETDKDGKEKTIIPDISENSYSGIFSSDRADLEPIADTSVKRILWGKPIKVQVRYLTSYQSGFNNDTTGKYGFPPRKSNGQLFGWARFPKKDDNNQYFNFYPASSDSAMSEVAENLRSRYTVNLDTNSAVYGHSFDSNATTFDEYLTRLYWDSVEGEWKFQKRDGTNTVCEKVIIFYTEPAYVSIENNTNYSLEFTSLTVLSRTVINTASQVGYGYVTAKNGETRSALLPPDVEKDLNTAGNLVLNAGDSIKMLFPGGVNSAYAMAGKFTGISDSTVSLFRTQGTTEGVYGDENITLDSDGAFSKLNDVSLTDGKLTGNTMNIYGGTHEIIFGKLRPICKILSDTIEGVVESEIAGHESPQNNPGKTAYLFSSISQAVTFAQKHLNKAATIEMLVDYLMPSSDQVVFPASSEITLTTAVGNPLIVGRVYSTDTEARASISRDSGNSNTLLKITTGGNGTELTVENLVFDGKNLAGNIDGGVLRTKDSKVTITNVDFNNCIANNGGGMYIDYTMTQGTRTETDKDGKEKTVNTGIWTYSYPEIAVLSVTDCKFTGCVSKSTDSRVGGGAIWTQAKSLILTNCVFTSCTAVDQGGAVFHRIDGFVEGTGTYGDEDYKFGTSTSATNCRFISCEAEAAGAFETDTSGVTLTGCTFSHCNAIERNGGAVNIYSNNKANNPNPSLVSVSGCTFTDCHAENTAEARYGGGLRSTALNTIVKNSTFTNTSSSYGGGISVSSTVAETATIEGCTISYGTALYRGGGIYSSAKVLSIDDYTDNGSNIHTTITNCTANEYGGGIYHARRVTGSSASITNVSVTGSSAGISGGGISIDSTLVTLTGCTIRNNTATSNGGGVNLGHQDGSILFDGCVITGNTAGGMGGGVYSPGLITIQNDTYIMSNRISGMDKNNAAGVYAGKQIKVGENKAGTDDELVKDNSTIKENYSAGGENSNLRLMMNGSVNNTASVSVQCHLGGEIYVVNAASKGTQFGSSMIEDPSGFADLKHVFTADDGSLYGIVDRTDTNGKKLIWAGEPVCKITDGSGNMLYFDEEHTASAIFDRLDIGDSGKRNKTSAFSALRMIQKNELTLYTQSGDPYTGAYCVKLLVEEYTVTKYIATPEDASMTITLTTADTTDTDGYPYRGRSGTRATLTRSTGSGNDHLLTARANFNLQNIIIDGGSEVDSNVAGTNTRILYVNKSGISVTIGTNTTLQNSHTIVNGNDTGNGAGVYVNSGSVSLEGGIIRNCVADGNGGGVYNKGTFELKSGSITRCIAGENGGGVYQNSSNFIMSGGSITNCGYNADGTMLTQSGGGVFVADGKSMNMSGGSITTNRAGTSGGGIAVGGSNNTKLNFSGTVRVSGNSLVSGDDSETCNVELNQDSNKIINTTESLSTSAYIGVYVPGEMDTTSSEYSADTNLFYKHGDADCPFGNYTSGINTDNLRYFVNDRNHLRGGAKSTSLNTIYWVRICFLEIDLHVLSDQSTDMTGTYYFDIELQGEGFDKDGKKVYYNDITGTYGNINFTNGVAHDVPVSVVDGEGSILAENLPSGLTYTVVEDFNTSGKGENYFTTIPAKDSNGDVKITGKIGRKDANGVTNYLSVADFTNIHAICKITLNNDTNTINNNDYTDYSGNLLYYKTGSKYEAAVYTKLATTTASERAAFKTINNNVTLYYHSSNGYQVYQGNGFNVEMLIENYSMTTPVTLTADRSVTLTTAGTGEGVSYPYAGGDDSTAEIERGYSGKSMFSVNRGTLILDSITLDGKNTQASGNGGLVSVGDVSSNNTAELKIQSEATLQNGKAVHGGAVYVTEKGNVTMTGGTVTDNTATSDGAGIYLAEGSKLYLSGSPDFGGNDLKGGTGDDKEDLKGSDGNFVVKGSSFKTGTDEPVNGSKTYPKQGVDYLVRQDIFIAGYSNSSEDDTSANSLAVNGNIGSGDGTIWIWAAESPRYKTLKQFAKITSSVTDTETTLAAFRNARPDSDTGAESVGRYLYGMTKTSDETGLNVYWYGVDGHRKVILRKVVESTYAPLSGKDFKIHQSSATGTLVKGTDINGNADVTAFPSGGSGVFFIGELNYGTYYIEETDPAKTFVIKVDKDGVGYQDANGNWSKEISAE